MIRNWNKDFDEFPAEQLDNAQLIFFLTLSLLLTISREEMLESSIV